MLTHGIIFQLGCKFWSLTYGVICFYFMFTYGATCEYATLIYVYIGIASFLIK